MAARKKHLQLGFPGAGPLGEDVYDEAHAVHHWPAPSPLQVPLLHSAQHVVDKYPAQDRGSAIRPTTSCIGMFLCNGACA